MTHSSTRNISKPQLYNWVWNYDKISSRPAWLNFAVPCVLTAIVTWLKLQYFVNNQSHIPFLLYFGVIIISTAYGGLRAAAVAGITTFIAAFVFFIYPYEGLDIQSITLVQLAGYLAETLFVVFLVGIVQHSHLQLKRREEKFRGIIEKSNEGFFMTDRDMRITYTCHSTTEILGYTENELKLLNYYSIIDADMAEEFKRNFSKLLDIDDYAIKVRHRLKTSDNRWIWVETVAKNLLNDSRIQRVVFHFRNITQKVNDEMHKEDFVNIASHELKNPITALIGYMHLLKSRITGNKDDIHNILGRMDVQLNKLREIISAMLDNTKISAGEIQYARRLFDLNECVREAVDAIRLNADLHDIKCFFESPARFIEADKEKIGQVITNLISNAIKYSPNGKSIEIVTALDRNNIKLSVADHGFGISMAEQQHIFERFYRAKTTSAKLPGLGLGLYISAEIIRGHNGKIGVESIEGDGATFWFTLPLENNDSIKNLNVNS